MRRRSRRPCASRRRNCGSAWAGRGGEAGGGEETRGALRRGPLGYKLVPVLCGSSFRNKGVQPLLDAIIDYLPSPLDLPPVQGIDPHTGGPAVREPSEDAPFAALAFKIVTDPYVGKLTYFRAYSGTLEAGSYIYNANKGQRERVSRILQMHANHREDIPEVAAGNVVAAVGLRVTTTGDTLCAEDAPIVLEAMQFPEPVIAVAVEPKTKADEDKLGASLVKLAEEDPTFKVRFDSETGQTLISGMGELHLEIIVDRLLREFKVEANVGRPQVAYKETIKQPARAEGRYIRQTGGRGQYGHVVLQGGPLQRGPGVGVVGKITPEQYMGDVIGDLNARRGRIMAMEQQGKSRVIRALVPLAEMFGYATAVGSATQGRGAPTTGGQENDERET